MDTVKQQMSKQLDASQQNLVAANSKIQSLVNENNQLKNSASKATIGIHKHAAAITTSTPAVDRISQLPTYHTPQNIAEEYKSLAKIIQGTETTIAIDKIHAEGSIALARLEADKKIKVLSFNLCHYLSSLMLNNFIDDIRSICATGKNNC